MNSQDIKSITRRINANAGAEVYSEAQVKTVLDRYEKLLAQRAVVPYVHGTADARDIIWTIYKSIWGASAARSDSWEFKFVSTVMQDWYYYTRPSGTIERSPTQEQKPAAFTEEQEQAGIPTWPLAIAVCLLAFFVFKK